MIILIILGDTMKEFIKTQKVTYNLMSFTGFKSLLIFQILTEGPKSFEEIGKIVENNPHLKEKMSTDTMRVYMNSLKRIGCEIKRVKGDDKISRYYISSHPFELNMTDEQKQSIIKVYKTLVKTMDIKDLLYIDNLLEKIGKYIKNEDFVSEIKKISALNDLDKDLLKELIEYSDKKCQITISYNSPKSGKKDIDVIADKVEAQNGKVYLFGYGFEYNEYGMFNVNKIKEIKEVKSVQQVPKDFKLIKVRYELANTGKEINLEENEKLIKRTATKIVIEVTSKNEFLLKQKFLEMGPQCKILEPESFRNDFVNTLKDMKVRYYCD